MGLISQKIERSQVLIGDHIYTWRAAYTYSHHGIYVDPNKVVHFTPEQTVNLRKKSSLSFSSISSSTSSKSSTSCSIPECGFWNSKSGVVLSCLDCFLGTGSLYRFEYKVSPPAFLSKLRGGTCTTAESDPCEIVTHRAICLLQKGFGKYNVLTNNCEDFAMYCKTGLLIKYKKSRGRSGQVASVYWAPYSAIGSSSLFLCMSIPAVAATAAGIYCYSRYLADIGVRSDVVKVPVEDLDSIKEQKGEGLKDLL